MKKHIFIEAILVIAILGVSFWNIQQHQENLSLRESVADQDEKQKELKQKQEELLQENGQLSEKNQAYSESIKKKQIVEKNTGVDSELNTEFINIVTKLFEANLNFTPENYDDRKREVSSYLSEDLKINYLGKNRNTYQEVNGTSSRLTNLEIFSKKSQNGKEEGLAVVNYQSKKSNQEWVNGMNIFKVVYDCKLKRISKIENLGSGYQNEIIE
ncbi:hypothetical protein KUA55_02975 [Enterococcus sp. ALS3]|uniref:Uncharacterized protein n=1 Tax=Enterococcus alishanensis TaxID=1303817 RepID=A0ABS6T9Q0_9ENTE|nr:hypothetical protein [Enterococcus alishanensis]MBV7389627.1 hypothetical protein [Enterococcus alishanensis]